MSIQAPRLNLAQKALLVVLVPLAGQVGFLGILMNLLQSAETALWQESHQRAIVTEIGELQRNFYALGQVYVVYTRTRDAYFDKQFTSLGKNVRAEIDLLKRLEQVEPIEREKVEEICAMCSDLLDHAERSQHLLMLGHKVPADASLEKLLVALSEINDKTAEVINASKLAQVTDSGSKADSYLNLVRLVLFGVVVNLGAAVGLSLWISTRSTRRLNVLMQNTHLMTGGKPLHPPIPGHDEIAQLDSVFHQMSKALRQSEQTRQELMAMVSHDLRAPLSSIQISLSLLAAGAKGNLPETAAAEVATAEANCLRLISLVGDLLDTSVLRSGELRMYKAECEIDGAVNKAIRAVAPLARAKSIVIMFAESEIRAAFDQDRIVQVLVNLIGNAIKFSPTQEVILIKAEQSQGRLLVSIEDKGPGVPVELKERIFEAYEQAQGAEPNGTGLGLAIAKAIVTAHGGTICVRANVDGGSTFAFDLPTDDDSPSESVETAELTANPIGSPDRG